MQCQLQMECTNAHSCILVSYHPETNSGNCFLIKRDHQLMDIVIEVCDTIYNDHFLGSWNYTETKELKNLGEKLARKKLSFEDLKPLRSYIKKCTKRAVVIEFIDEVHVDIS